MSSYGGIYEETVFAKGERCLSNGQPHFLRRKSGKNNFKNMDENNSELYN